MSEAVTPSIRIWDLPTRLFHWLLVVAVSGSVVSAKIGGEAMVWHFRFGYLVLALTVFRILWGLVGGRWSRFSSFVYAPSTLRRYLLGEASPAEQLEVGHSPTGALSVFAFLALLGLQLSTGLVANDEISNVGPLNRFVSNDTAQSATSWHHGWGQWLILSLVALHVAAIAFHRFSKGVDLVRPMLDGDKALPMNTSASADGWPQRALAVALFAVCAALALWVSRFGES